MKSPLLLLALLAPLGLSAAEHRVNSPDGKLALVVSDDAGLRYRVELDGKPLLADSVLGLDFADGTTLGPAAKITETKKAARNATWDNLVAQPSSRHVAGRRSVKGLLRPVHLPARRYHHPRQSRSARRHS